MVLKQHLASPKEHLKEQLQRQKEHILSIHTEHISFFNYLQKEHQKGHILSYSLLLSLRNTLAYYL